MKLFKKTQKKEKELPSQPQKIDLETLINELAEHPPKEMEKIITLAKARREYNQKLEALKKNLGETAEEEEEPSPESIEATLEALKDLEPDDGSFTYIETTAEVPTGNKKKDKDKE